jgi:hypothetical protein
MKEEMDVERMLNDPDEKTKRGFYVLLWTRAAMGYTFEKALSVEEAHKHENKMRNTGDWVRKYEAHTDKEALLALIVQAYQWVEDPDSVMTRHGRERKPISRQVAKPILQDLLKAATKESVPDDDEPEEEEKAEEEVFPV